MVSSCGRTTVDAGTWFGDNWPDRARQRLPTVDHPSDKATVRWQVTASRDSRSSRTGYLSRLYRVRRRTKPYGTRRGQLLRTSWSSPPHHSSGMTSTRRCHVGYRKQCVKQSVYVLPENRSLSAGCVHRGGLDRWALRVARWTISLRRARAPPVEHAVWWNGELAARSSMMARSSLCRKAKDGLLAHETAHQWFGDAVTEPWRAVAASMSRAAAASTSAGSTGGSWMTMGARVPNEPVSCTPRARVVARREGQAAVDFGDRRPGVVRGAGRCGSSGRGCPRRGRCRADEPDAAALLLDPGRGRADRAERLVVDGMLDAIEELGVVQHGLDPWVGPSWVAGPGSRADDPILDAASVRSTGAKVPPSAPFGGERVRPPAPPGDRPQDGARGAGPRRRDAPDPLRGGRGGADEPQAAVIVGDGGRGAADGQYGSSSRARSISSSIWSFSNMGKHPSGFKIGTGGTEASRRCSYHAPDRRRGRWPPGVGEVAVRGRCQSARWRARVRPGAPAQVGRRGAPSERQRDLELLAEDGEGPLDAGLRRRPPAPSSIGRPTSTPRAPSASAMAMSRPRRTPPSTQTSVRPSTAATTSASDVDRRPGRRSSCRAPWLLTTIAVDAVLDREPRVLGGEDPLDDERQRRPAPGSSARSAQVEAAVHGPVLRVATGASSAAVRWLRRGRRAKLPSAGSANPDRRSRSR